MIRPAFPLLTVLIVPLLSLATPARAVVGGLDAPDAALARSSVMVLSSRGGVCTGIVLARDVVLTAAHCAAPGVEHRVHFRDEAGAPVLLAVAARAVHPGYDAGAIPEAYAAVPRFEKPVTFDTILRALSTLMQPA